MNSKVKEWHGLSKEDFDVAELTFKSKRYTHTVFMCQQAIEKSIKAVYVKKFNKVPPRKHDLLALCRDIGIIDELSDEYKKMLAYISSMYILARYPDTSRMGYSKPDRKKARKVLITTKEVLEWLETEMK